MLYVPVYWDMATRGLQLLISIMNWMEYFINFSVIAVFFTFYSASSMAFHEGKIRVTGYVRGY